MTRENKRKDKTIYATKLAKRQNSITQHTRQNKKTTQDNLPDNTREVVLCTLQPPAKPDKSQQEVQEGLLPPPCFI